MKHNVVILNDPSKAMRSTKAITAPGNLPKDPAIIAATPMADAGKTEVTFVAPKPGRYTFICTSRALRNDEGIMIVE